MSAPQERTAVVLTLSEPELWAVIRAHRLPLVPVSPLAALAQAAATLDPLLDAGRQGLAAQKLTDGERINYLLVAAVKVLCHPQECLALVERGALGTHMRAYYGARELFIGHTRQETQHVLAFPYTRAQLLGLAAQAAGLQPPAGGRRG